VENSSLLNKIRLCKRKKINLFALIFLCIITGTSTVFGKSHTAGSSNIPLTIMTYNIHHGRGLDGEIDIDRIADVICQSQADIVALQEVDVNTKRSGNIDIVKVLSEKTGLLYTAFGQNLEFEGGKYGNAILSRYPLKNIENHHFENISGEQRGVLSATIDINNRDILFLNTHLDHTEDDDSERVLYTEKIRDHIISLYKNQTVILAGDFNDFPGSRMYQIVQSYMSDSWIQAGTGDGFTIPVNNPEKRIDYIFYSGELKPVTANVVQSIASDHLPVVVKFLFIND
jgi:endonuclease/exonuclease/phosphatase family metal-dependent hydrolase